MKNFKKVLTSLVLVFAIVLVGCSGEKKSKFVKEENGDVVNITVHHKSNKVNKVNVDGTMNYKNNKVENAEQAKMAFSMISGMVNNINGVKLDVNYGENEATINFSVDFNKIDQNQLKQLMGSFGDSSQNLEKEFEELREFDKMESKLKESGFTPK